MSADAKCGEPWRKTPKWNTKLLDDLKKETKGYTPSEGFAFTKARILMVGQVGSGKSSFINTINSIFKGHITSQACSGNAQESLTTEYRMYQIRSGKNGQPMNFRLHDTRGIEAGQGVDEMEMCYLLDGNVPNRHQFNPSVPLSPNTPGFIKNPLLSEKIHCAVFVIDGTTIDVMVENITEKMNKFKKCMNQRGIPQIVLLTKIDKICQKTETDLSNVFYSTPIKEAVDKISQIMGLPRSHIIPVKNYESEMDLNTNVSILALLSLQKMLHFADDGMNNQKGEDYYDVLSNTTIFFMLAFVCLLGLWFYE
ncbi:interferon-induced protein 44-like isoform X3 [Mytilus galloprovincialis]|uniref:interferon-induced protein 44-like isoform X3 n=1 Tax=Mytilus galloprovincialis TaxID=29158 RepID=UPI003F7C2CB7